MVHQVRAAHSPIVIADADTQSRADVVRALQGAGFETREAATGDDAVAAVHDAYPALVILEIPLQGMCGYELCHRLRDEFGEGLPIVFLSGERTEWFDRVAGLLIGADDYLVKPVVPDELLARVRALIRRATPPSSQPGVVSELTERERQVLQLLTEGLEQTEIAKRLYISPKTVNTHTQSIFRKLGVRNRAHAVAAAYQLDLVVPLAPTPE
jgi:DNA-binding NarL/FixJ family response regulator